MELVESLQLKYDGSCFDEFLLGPRGSSATSVTGSRIRLYLIISEFAITSKFIAVISPFLTPRPCSILLSRFPPPPTIIHLDRPTASFGSEKPSFPKFRKEDSRRRTTPEDRETFGRGGPRRGKESFSDLACASAAQFRRPAERSAAGRHRR